MSPLVHATIAFVSLVIVIAPALLWTGRKLLNWLARELDLRARRIRDSEANAHKRTIDFRVGSVGK